MLFSARLSRGLKRRYEFRYNTQIAEVEYRERLSFRFRFNPLDKRALNSLSLIHISYVEEPNMIMTSTLELLSFVATDRGLNGDKIRYMICDALREAVAPHIDKFLTSTCLLYTSRCV